ncbi:hypothetical protein ACOSP7_018805 [Xanthoceras sorbifolium]
MLFHPLDQHPISDLYVVQAIDGGNPRSCSQRSANIGLFGWVGFDRGSGRSYGIVLSGLSLFLSFDSSN